MLLETRKAIVEHAVRWAANILNEVLSNHGHVLPADARECLKQASHALSKAATLL